jgi:hypothetical protein
MEKKKKGRGRERENIFSDNVQPTMIIVKVPSIFFLSRFKLQNVYNYQSDMSEYVHTYLKHCIWGRK